MARSLNRFVFVRIAAVRVQNKFLATQIVQPPRITSAEG